MDTPVVLTLFNSPQTVRRVFAHIKDAQPTKLFLISDAGRTPEEQKLIEESRHIAETVDWPCEVIKDYSEVNMGARKRLATGITKVFEQVDRAIILEHDCLPDPTFFTFCEELLEKYQNDDRVMHISGTNFQQKNPALYIDTSYYFSLFPQIWGFATWARAWKHYDPDIQAWPEIKHGGQLKSIFNDPAAFERWTLRFDEYYKGIAQSWDGQWAFACLTHNGLSATPAKNLISNIGFSEQALTTKDASSWLANISAEPLSFPLTHPTQIKSNDVADAYVLRHIFDVNRTIGQRVRWFFRSRFPALYALLKSLVKTSS